VAQGFVCPACGKYVSESLVPGQQSRCTFCGQSVIMDQPRTPAPEATEPEHIYCARCGLQNAGNSYKCTSCGFVLRGEPKTIVTSEATMGGLIPAGNPPALWSYYLGIFSLIPCFGLPVSIAAIITGIMGLRKVKAAPEVKGKVHAIIGLCLGGVVLVCYVLFGVFMVIGMINEAK
jgi:hypothetical protein